MEFIDYLKRINLKDPNEICGSILAPIQMAINSK